MDMNEIADMVEQIVDKKVVKKVVNEFITSFDLESVINNNPVGVTKEQVLDNFSDVAHALLITHFLGICQRAISPMGLVEIILTTHVAKEHAEELKESAKISELLNSLVSSGGLKHG